MNVKTRTRGINEHQKVNVEGLGRFVSSEDLPKTEFGSRLNRVKKLFGTLEIKPSRLVETKNVADILYEGDIIARVILKTTNGGGKKEDRSIAMANSLKDFRILLANHKRTGIPFWQMSEDRKFVSKNGKVVNGESKESMFLIPTYNEVMKAEETYQSGHTPCTRHYRYQLLEEARENNAIGMNKAANVVAVPANQLEDYIFDTMLHQPRYE